MKKIKKRTEPEKIIAGIILTIVSLIFIVPVIWVFLSAFKLDTELNRAGGFMILPKTWTLENFKMVLSTTNSRTPVYRWFANSAFVSVIYVILSVIIVSTAAYAFSKLHWKGRDTVFLLILFITSFPPIMSIVPMYKIMQVLHLLNTPWALIFPGLAGAFNIFLTKQFMFTISDDILDAARIDGAGEGTIFFRVVLPMMKPILAIVSLFSFTAIWNDFLWPSIAINDINNLTLTAGLQLAKGTYEQVVSKISAMAVVAIVPMIVLYCFAERWLLRGVSISSGVKG